MLHKMIIGTSNRYIKWPVQRPSPRENSSSHRGLCGSHQPENKPTLRLMKIKKLAMAALLALASVASSYATTTIHLIGSTAYRAAVNDAIRHVLAPGYTWAISASGTTNSSLAGASAGWWKGALIQQRRHS